MSRPMGPRRALPKPPPEMVAALGPPPSALDQHPPQPAYLSGGPSATPIPSPIPSPGLGFQTPPGFQAPPPPPPLPHQSVQPLNIQRPRPRVQVPRHSIPSDIDSADADDENARRKPVSRPSGLGHVIDERSPIPVEHYTPSPGPLKSRLGNPSKARPVLGLRTASGSALPDEDAPPQVDPTASLPSLKPKLSLSVAPKPKLGLSIGGSLKLDVNAQPPSDDDADYSYYGFKPTSKHAPSLSLNVGEFPSDATTMQPNSTTTMRPGTHTAKPPGAGGEIDELRRAIGELRMPELEEELEMRGLGEKPEEIEWADEHLEVIEHLGEGAGGAVCKVVDKRNGRVMARKPIPASIPSQPISSLPISLPINPCALRQTIPTGTVPARQLLRELQFSKLTHPNLIVCYGAYITAPPSEQENTPPEIHMLMELGEGGALDSIARRMKSHHANVRIGEKVIARLAEGVLKGLDYLHSNKVTHRDIKPSNILVTKAGVVKLCDFGVSGDLEMSLASTFTGTSWYMAPERITGNQYSIRADVWSTGLTFLELAQNRFPYPPDLGPIELLTYIVNGEVPELEDEPGDENGNGAIHWTDGMKSFIKLCLRIDASQRPTPGKMLEHPWIQESIARKLDMSKWIREVWGWEKPPKSKRASQA
ncbi:unnamed protein product [Rhizoctonia solani]|uniref:mitogen-activated protein kinase kinase n=1 Tax=Rhizoctonia solani TaxID=456999 RepID=A0A8H3EDT5_9AGAM|nr:unnamed protein product [Rhizoctonia solani]